MILVGMVLFAILIVSVLSLFGLGDVDRVVTLKNLLAGCLRGVAVAVLIFEGVVNWSYGIPMVLGCLIGGYVGGMVSNRAPRRFLRALFIVIGFGATALLLARVRRADPTHRGRIVGRIPDVLPRKYWLA